MLTKGKLRTHSIDAPAGRTLAARLASTDGRPSGFDYLRIVLALSIVAFHSAITAGGKSADTALWASPLQPLLRAILPMFFALSGFLVAGSLERCRTLVSFLGLRVIRIYPALMVEVLLSALIIGPGVTRLSSGAYFGGSEFRHYLLNMTGDIHYRLPGVFANNPFPEIVNLQLWTVPYELGCYLSLAMLAVFGLVRRPFLAPLAAAALCTAHFAYRLFAHHGVFPSAVVQGPLLIVSFLCGIALYLYRDRVPWDRWLFAAAAIASLVLLRGVPAGAYPSVILLGYVTVWLGLTNARRIFIIRGADLSYGVFLYGFVIQQLFAFLFPHDRFWWLNILVCIPCALGFAALSWGLIEKPALRLKKPLMALEGMLVPPRPQSGWSVKSHEGVDTPRPA
jgi:peptidoglycan/LPS O-acetylase OafA/YrhL